MLCIYENYDQCFSPLHCWRKSRENTYWHLFLEKLLFWIVIHKSNMLWVFIAWLVPTSGYCYLLKLNIKLGFVLVFSGFSNSAYLPFSGCVTWINMGKFSKTNAHSYFHLIWLGYLCWAAGANLRYLWDLHDKSPLKQVNKPKLDCYLTECITL